MLIRPLEAGGLKPLEKHGGSHLGLFCEQLSDQVPVRIEHGGPGGGFAQRLIRVFQILADGLAGQLQAPGDLAAGAAVAVEAMDLKEGSLIQHGRPPGGIAR